MTDPMLEKAARAAYDKNPSVPKGTGFLGDKAWDELGPWQQKGFVNGMRAALTAIRTPDETAIEAGHRSIEYQYVQDYCPVFEDAWQAAIDAILKEGT